jgi:hypothetical protein
VRVPAFFDGDGTWRVRYTPNRAGAYAIDAITLNGKAVDAQELNPRQFAVGGERGHGFIHVERTKSTTGFAFDDGTVYYPLGHNLGWSGGSVPSLPDALAEMGAGRANWARIWMCSWDGKNLDWHNDQSRVEPGTLDLESARKWDAIVAAAEKAGVHFQMVLQHHGQVNGEMWQYNPWNKANGGWMTSADEFFTDARALAITRAKYRYYVARWGYSPAVLAWELFNEIENVETLDSKPQSVYAWHKAMAEFIRQQDVQHHMVTTSADVSRGELWEAMDYYQPHTYTADLAASLEAMEQRKSIADKPWFFGEWGPNANWEHEDGRRVHSALWASLMSESCGTAQYWYWDIVHDQRLYPRFEAAQGFIAASGLLQQAGLRRVRIVADCPSRGTLRFGPGTQWAQAAQTEFVVERSGRVAGIGQMPEFLHGDSHREMFPAATFRVDYPEAGMFAVKVATASRSGSRLCAIVDGVLAAEMGFDATERDAQVNATMQFPVPAGAHVIKLENRGVDWVKLGQLSLTHYVPALGVLGKANDHYAVLWVYRRDDAGGTEAAAAGKLSIPGLSAGTYEVSWWNPYTGQVASHTMASVAAGEALTLEIPAVEKDLAAWVRRSE